MWKRLFKSSRDPAQVSPPELLTLKQRVAAFWSWYASVARRFYSEIENKRCGTLEPEVSGKVTELLPGMGWVFGPGEGGGGHSLTLTPEGDAHKRLVAQYWRQCAPQLPGWTFYASRQPSTLHISGQSIRIDNNDFGAHEIWLTPHVDEQKEKVDLTVWHPLFDHIEKRLRWTVTFLWLDEALGEDGVVEWIGEINLGNDKLAGAIPLSELPEFIDELERERGWKKLPPHECCSGYRRKEPERGGVRGDIMAGSTLLMEIVHEFPLESNPLAAFGAEYEMLFLPIELFPPGQQVETRGRLEDGLAAAFDKERSGKVLGGATGLENSYIDLVLFDGNRSSHLVKSVLAGSPFAEHYQTAPFVKR